MRKFNVNVNGTVYTVEVEEVGGAVTALLPPCRPASRRRSCGCSCSCCRSCSGSCRCSCCCSCSRCQTGRCCSCWLRNRVRSHARQDPVR